MVRGFFTGFLPVGIRRVWISSFSLISTLFLLLISLNSCGTFEEENTNSRVIWRDMIVKKDLEVWSVFGSKKMREDATVEIGEWASDKPQLLIAVDKEGKTYFMSYVIPEELANDVSAKNLSYFYQNKYVNIDERTTALSLVIMSPPYFWMFSPRALVFAADKVVQHPDFETLVSKIREMNRMYPGTLTTESAKEIYALASKIAEDIRNSLDIRGLKEYMSPRLDYQGSSSSCISEEEFYQRNGLAELKDAPGMNIKFVHRHMVYFGGGFYSSEEPWDPNKVNLQRVFVVNAQDGKIDLSLDNILSFNIFNPKVETEVEAPGGLHTVKIYKGWEFSTSIFTEHAKRVGLVANLGRIIKFVFELVVPNIAACIPDGYTWGYVVSYITNLNIDPTFQQSILSLIWNSGAWQTIINLIRDHLPGWVQWLLGKVGLSGCGSGVNFVINQLAATLSNFPVVKIWNALTKYIPFGWELFTLPNSGAWLVAGGQPIYGVIVIRDLQPRSGLKSGQNVTLDIFGARCLNCGFEIFCPNGSDVIGLGPLFCAESYSFSWPFQLWGDCKIKLIQQSSGGARTVVQQVNVHVDKCPDGQDCSGWVDPMQGKEVGVTEEKGCNATSPQFSVLYIFALLVIFSRTIYERRKKFASEN